MGRCDRTIMFSQEDMLGRLLNLLNSTGCYHKLIHACMAAVAQYRAVVPTYGVHFLLNVPVFNLAGGI